MIDFTDKKISDYIKSQLPEFVSVENETFVAFIKAYYEFMENQANVLDISRNLANYQDITRTIDRFVDYFLKEIADGIPKEIASDKLKLAMYAKQLYKSKGTEESFKFFFRLIYNEDIELYYPKNDILKLSDGVWIKNKIIRVLTDPRLFDSLGQTISGRRSLATAVIDNVLVQKIGNLVIADITLINILGNFELGETLDSKTEDGEIFQIIPMNIVSSIDVTSGGLGYTTSDEITITDNTNNGQSAIARITSVSSLGAIRKIEMINPGVNYPIGTQVTLPTGGTITQAADLVLNIGYVAETIGSYQDTRGHLSSNKYIQDSFFYQDYSYVIRSGLEVNTYRKLIKKLIHPSGLILFGQVLIQKLINIFTLFDAETNTIVRYFNQVLDYTDNDVVSFVQLTTPVRSYVTISQSTSVNSFTQISALSRQVSMAGLISDYEDITLADASNLSFGLFITRPDVSIYAYLGSTDLAVVTDTDRSTI